ncbi:MAG: hypothetical protein K2W96_13565 [Gemmataceae bacterium]|nr:hypothetical protein [Gemmataceae bacterium]
MSALAEFLREKAGTWKHLTEANQQTISEWRSAVEALFATLRRWLAEADPEGVLLVEQREMEVKEPGLGRYKVPRLDLRTVDQWIGIIPKARNTVVSASPKLKAHPLRATGRVDITDEVRSYILFRLPEAEGDAWYIDDMREQKRLDRQAFEDALLGYLR